MSRMKLKVYNYNNLPNVVSYVIIDRDPWEMSDIKRHNYFVDRAHFYKTKRKDFVIRNYGSYTIYHINTGIDGRKVYTLINLEGE